MWSHYAESFQGVCLAFDPTKFENGLKLGGFPVDYPPTRTSLPPSFYDVYQSMTAEKVEFGGVRFETDSESGLLLMRHNREKYCGNTSSLFSRRNHRLEIRAGGQDDLHLGTIRAWSTTQIRISVRGMPHAKRTLEQCENPTYRDVLRVACRSNLAVIFERTRAGRMSLQSWLCSTVLIFAHVAFTGRRCTPTNTFSNTNRDDKDAGENGISLFIQEERERQIAQAKAMCATAKMRFTISRQENCELRAETGRCRRCTQASNESAHERPRA